jgi:iron complex outermembrane receptor protein
MLKTKKWQVFAMIIMMVYMISMFNWVNAEEKTTATQDGTTNTTQEQGQNKDSKKIDSKDDNSPKSDNVPVTDVDVQEQKGGSADSGYRTDTANVGPLGEQSQQDTPYSVNVTSGDMLDNLQADSVSAALKYNPTVSNGSGSNSVGGGTSFTIRGFTSSTMAIDGMRTELNGPPIEDKEQIEVLNGAAGFLYGIANPGGIINYVLKRPTATPLEKITIGNYGGDQNYFHGDFGGPIDKADKFGYRANILYVNKGETEVDDAQHGRQLVSTAFDWQVASGGLLTFDYSHFDSDIEHGDNIFTIGTGVTSVPSAPDASKNFMPSYSTAKDSYDRYGLGYTKEISDIFTFRSAIRYNDESRYRHRASSALTDNDGNFTMSRNYYDTEAITTQGYSFLDAQFQTGSMGHKMTFGFSEDYTKTLSAYPYTTGKVTYSGTNNIYKPAPWPVDKVGETVGEPNKPTAKTLYTSTLLGDQITLTQQWALFFGVNHVGLDVKSWSYNTSGVATAQPENEKDALTPAASLTYKINPKMTSYISYIESLQAGPTVGSTYANAGEVLDPYRSNQKEIGLKTQLGGMNVNVALFRMEKANAYADAVTNIYSKDGREVHTGLELTATGKLSQNLTLTGGFTVLNAEITKSSDAIQIGNTPSGVPERLARLYTEYAIPAISGLVLTGGISYTDKEWVDSSNHETLSIPEVITGDIGIRYRCKYYGHDMTLRLNVKNVTDKNYWTSTGGGSLSLGDPRTISFSAEIPFL